MQYLSANSNYSGTQTSILTSENILFPLGCNFMPSISSPIILSLMQMTSAHSLLYVSQIVTAISIANIWDPIIQTNLLCFHLTEQCAGYIHHPSCHSGFTNTVFQFCLVLRAVIFSLNMVQRDEHHTVHYLSNHWNNKQRKQNL